MIATPLLDSQVGYGWTTCKVSRALTERDELCQCGRTHENQEHLDFCADARAERFRALREKMNRKHNYIELEVA